MASPSTTKPGRAAGCLLGIMAGDSVGLPRENMRPERADKFFGTRPRQALFLGRGMTSDDTELACFTAQALLKSRGEPEAFARGLGWKLRWWLWSLPPGIGLATGRAILKLWLGFPPHKSGVFSAGNGPALRAPVLGVWTDDDAELAELNRRSTIITHSDPQAAAAALDVARAAAYAARVDRGEFAAEALLGRLSAPWTKDLAALRGKTAAGVLAHLGTPAGVGGYIVHSALGALWAWLEDPFDFRGGMRRVLELGGDADSVGAIFGGLCGAAVGAEGVPAEYLDNLLEFPRTARWVGELGARLQARGEPLPLAWPLYALRSPLQWVLVLGHGLRRGLPPY